MICRMCLLDSTEVLNIFGTASHQFNIATTIAEHFWFEPKEDDPISNIVCNSCWWKIESFHVYYRSVEDAHRKLSERFSVKQEPHHSHHANTGIQVYLKVEDGTPVEIKEPVVPKEFDVSDNPDGIIVVGDDSEGIIVSGENGATLIEIVDEKLEDEGECSYDAQCDEFNDAAAESSEHMSEEGKKNEEKAKHMTEKTSSPEQKQATSDEGTPTTSQGVTKRQRKLSGGYTSYNKEQKELLIKLYEDGLTVKAASSMAGIKLNSAKSILRLYKLNDYGLVEGRRGGSRRKKLTEEVLTKIGSCVESNPGITLHEIKRMLAEEHINVSTSTIHTGLRNNLGIL